MRAPIVASVQVESVSNTPLTKLLLKIASSLEHEQVVTIRSVRIALWDRLVHQQIAGKIAAVESPCCRSAPIGITGTLNLRR